MSLAGSQAVGLDLLGLMSVPRSAAERAGLRVYDDIRDAVPPCLVLLPPTVSFRFGKGYVDVQHTALALAGNTERRAQYDELSGLIEAFQQAMRGAVIVARPAAQVWTVDHGAVTAAYELTWTDQQ